MKIFSTTLLCALALTAALATAAPGRSEVALAAEAAGKTTVTWKGKSFAPSKAPEGLPQNARFSIEAWVAWCDSKGYRMHLTDDARVLMVHDLGDSDARRHLELIEKVTGFFDERLPAPPRMEVGGDLLSDLDELLGGKRGGGDDVIPEDPEAAPVEETQATPRGADPWVETWGAGTAELDVATGVMFVLEKPAHYDSVVDAIAKRFSYLGPWVKEARGAGGFVLEEPLSGCYVKGIEVNEEWSGEHELVHRVAELLLVRRFGRQPYWVQQGWAWHTELSLMGSIYCFPYRNEFVGVGEHGGWDKDLSRFFDESSKLDVWVTDIGALRRGVWNDRHAKVAWGTVKFLVEQHGAALPPLLEELRVEWDRLDRIDQGDGTWKRDLQFRLPDSVQREVLERHAGADVLERFTAWCRAL